MKAALTLFLMLIPTLASAQVDPGASAPRETTDVYIRRLAGLPASSAEGDIKIIDVGHSPLSTMLSIVARRVSAGWRVSYACAASPRCSADADHLAMTYDLGDAAARRVDAILAALKTGGDPGGTKPNPALVCGDLTVVINYQGFRRDYSRSCSWGRTLGELERLLEPHGSAS